MMILDGTSDYPAANPGYYMQHPGGEPRLHSRTSSSSSGGGGTSTTTPPDRAPRMSSRSSSTELMSDGGTSGSSSDTAPASGAGGSRGELMWTDDHRYSRTRPHLRNADSPSSCYSDSAMLSPPRRLAAAEMSPHFLNNTYHSGFTQGSLSRDSGRRGTGGHCPPPSGPRAMVAPPGVELHPFTDGDSADSGYRDMSPTGPEDANGFPYGGPPVRLTASYDGYALGKVLQMHKSLTRDYLRHGGGGGGRSSGGRAGGGDGPLARPRSEMPSPQLHHYPCNDRGYHIPPSNDHHLRNYVKMSPPRSYVDGGDPPRPSLASRQPAQRTGYPSDEGVVMGTSGFDKEVARARFQTRALSADFGLLKTPTFPCHMAALGEGEGESPHPEHAPAQRPTTLSHPPLYPPPHHNGVVHHGVGYRPQAHSAPATPLSELPHRKNPPKHHVLQAFSELFRPKKPSSHEPKPLGQGDLRRSTSAPQKLNELCDTDDTDTDADDDTDVDEDDYGFRSHPKFQHLHACGSSPPSSNSCHGNSTLSVSDAAMHKAKSPSPARRILPKRWRKSKLSAKPAPSTWKSEGACTWCGAGGRRVVLTPGSLLSLTPLESSTLQKLAVARLHALQLGCPITVPKEYSKKRSKRGGFSLRRSKTASSSFLDNLRTKDKDGKDCLGQGWVFGLPLDKCIANDSELRRRISMVVPAGEGPTATPRQNRKSSSSSVSVLHQADQRPRSLMLCDCGTPSMAHPPSYHLHGGAVSSDSLSESDNRRPGSNLLDALSLSSSAKLESLQHGEGGSGGDTSCSGVTPHTPHVPYVVNTCCNYLQQYGLQVVGIFRIGNSKKRTRQLREEFDSGRVVKLGEDINVHDVAGVFKEFFRDLPDPLLTRDLYPAFLATTKMRSEVERLSAVQHLVSLLPTANRDTLRTLLAFLAVIAKHSKDALDHNGHTLPGNKMDCNNLATLFGPNILHMSQGGEFEVESLERLEERRDVINVVKDLIERHQSLFQVSAELQHEVLRSLHDSHPEELDIILKQRAASVLGIDADPETSTSSYYEGESDSSSMPRSPGYGGPDPGRPHNLTDALRQAAHYAAAPLHPHHHSSVPSTPLVPHQPYHPAPPARVGGAPRVRSADPSTRASHADPPSPAKQPVGLTVSAPGTREEWFRSTSPASPRVSPSPKAMKAGTPDFHIRITTTESPERHLSASTQALVSPHSGRVRRSVGIPHGPGPRSDRNRNMLTVPGGGRPKNAESNSSLSSGYYAGSSRSGTNSPDPTGSSGSSKWYLDTPPDSPKDKVSPPSPFNRTSSTQRPLGFNVPATSTTSLIQPSLTSPVSLSLTSPGNVNRTVTSPTLNRHPMTSSPPTSRESMAGGRWQRERWRHWENIAKKHNDEFHEQETLV